MPLESEKPEVRQADKEDQYVPAFLGIVEIDKGRLEEIHREVDELGRNTYHFEAE